MEFTGKISLREVDRKAFEITSDQTHRWVKALLIGACPGEDLVGMSPEEWAEKSHIEVKARIEKMGVDYLVSGHIKGEVPALCSRCGDSFLAGRMQPQISVFVHKLGRGSEEALEPGGPDTGDPDYVYVSKDEANLIDIFREHLIILESVAEAPPLDPETDNCSLCKKENCRVLPGLGEVPENAGVGALSEFAKALDKLKKSGQF